jgi:DNA-binding GntR family transcriptional regulator
MAGSILSVLEDVHIPPRRSLAEEAADRLREAILLEQLAPGTPVTERELSEAMGISRTPLKDALRILEVEGLIEYGPTRRPRVANPSLETLRDNINVLGALEALAGELACAVATDADLADIAARARRMETDSGDALTFFHQDMAFHGAIVAAARNAPLAETHRQYNARLWRARFLSSRQIDRRGNTLEEHARIVAALSARDAPTTARALRAHLRSTIDNIARLHLDPGDRTGGSATA